VPAENPQAYPERTQKRRQIAKLLAFLAPRDMDWQNRVQTVVGVTAYTAAVDAQAKALEAMTDRARMILRRDQSNFVGEYQMYLDTLRAQADSAASLDQRITREQTLLNEQKALLERYVVETEVDDPANPGKTKRASVDISLRARVAEFQKKLADQTAATTAALATQADLERQIFEVQQQIVLTQDAITETEKRLRELEAKRRP